ncbi:Fe-S protein assembly co-chaperone HscB [Buchnera aphidicola]|uniref:Co-chaperone protein HscB n=1 Tax=Buchnera aphidicola (Artemisaphis artemisicola) TaxID=1241836 RepID=A0A4D6XQW1_9GAMM|nr:Fe-S protein assembly co-chaperone HscB [Buchnera aphidicola]QCI16241.1 Fe-S protein assembly co-chaperone HscB [Buchnera aphidicola (Artemisaphis artemisicola)]
MNYFELFNIPKKFKINKNLLSKNYYQLQLKFHPDLFINHSSFEKKIALKKSIEINKGYNTLKNFLSRAIYLLNLYNFKIKKEVILLKNNDFLIQYFSLYEELDFLKKNSFQKFQVNFFFEKIEKKIKKYEKKIEIEFKNKNFEKVVQIIARLLFLKKIKLTLRKEQNMYLR